MRFLLLIALMMSTAAGAGTVWLDDNWEILPDEQNAHFYFRQPELQEAGLWPITIYYFDSENAAGRDSTDKERVRFQGAMNHADFTQSSIVGEYRFYYPSGVLLEVGHRGEKGFLNGEVKHYREDGTLKGVYQYQHEKLQGKQKEFFTNGKLSRVETREQGKKLGLSQRYFENGQLRSQYIYGVEGIEGQGKQFYDDGTLQSEGEYRRGKRHGLSRFYNRQGKLAYTTSYNLGKRQGEEKKYFADGALHSVAEYQGGVKVGKEMLYYQNGQLQKEASYDDKGRLLSEVNLYDSGKKRRTVNNEYWGKDKYSTELRYRDNKITVRNQSDTAIKWTLKEIFDKNGVLIRRTETQDGKYTGLKLDAHQLWGGGQEVVRQYFVNGKKQGAYQRFNDAGKEIERGWYEQDKKVGEWWQADDESELTEHYDNQGRLSGERKEVATDGKLLLLEHYLAGKRHGKAEQYNEHGLLLKGEYVNGLREGYWQFRDDYSSERKIWQGHYRNGKQIGDWQAVSQRGYLLGQGQYDEQGRRQGIFYEFAESGLLIDTSVYIDDRWQSDSSLSLFSE